MILQPRTLELMNERLRRGARSMQDEATSDLLQRLLRLHNRLSPNFPQSEQAKVSDPVDSRAALGASASRPAPVDFPSGPLEAKMVDRAILVSGCAPVPATPHAAADSELQKRQKRFLDTVRSVWSLTSRFNYSSALAGNDNQRIEEFFQKSQRLKEAACTFGIFSRKNSANIMDEEILAVLQPLRNALNGDPGSNHFPDQDDLKKLLDDLLDLHSRLTAFPQRPEDVTASCNPQRRFIKAVSEIWTLTPDISYDDAFTTEDYSIIENFFQKSQRLKE